MKKQIAYLVISALTLSGGAKGQQIYNGICDSLFQQVQLLSAENIQKATVVTRECSFRAKKTGSRTDSIYSLLARSEVLSATKLYNQALVTVDSALTLAAQLADNSPHLSAMLQKSRILLAEGSAKLAWKNLNRAYREAVKEKEHELSVKTLLLQADIKRKEGNLKEAERLQLLALNIAKKNKLKHSEALCNLSIGSRLWKTGLYNQALEHYFKALILFEELNKNAGILLAHKNIGLTYKESGQFDKALEHLNNALDLAIITGSRFEQASTLNLIGSLYFKFKQLDLAYDFYMQSLLLSERNGFHHLALTTRSNIARIHTQRQNFDSSLANLQRALYHQEQLNAPLAEASLLNEMGTLNLTRGNIPEALKRYLMALKIRQAYGTPETIAKSLINIGLTYKKLGMLDNARDYLEKAYQTIQGKTVKPTDAAYILQLLGNLYLDRDQPVKAIGSYRKALDYQKKSGNKIGTAKLYLNLAKAYLKSNRIAEARNAALKGIAITTKYRFASVEAQLYNELGNIQWKAKRRTRAIANFNHAIVLFRELQDKNGEALCIRKIGEIEIELKQFDAAREKINRSINLGKELKNPYLVLYGRLALKKFHLAQNNHKKALACYEQYIALRDSINQSLRSEATIKAQIDLELDKTKSEIKLIEAEVKALKQQAELDSIKLEKQRTVRNFLIVIVILVLIVLAILYQSIIQKRRHNKELQANIERTNEANARLTLSEKNLKEANRTKDKLFSIIAHDLRSPFTSLVNLSEMLASKIDELSINEIKEFSSHIHQSSLNVLSLIDNLLSWSRAQTGRLRLSPETFAPAALIDSIMAVSSLQAEEKKLTVRNNIDPKLRVYADYKSIETVFRNLIGNAIKFTPEKGSITLDASSDGNTVEIKISDTGVGIAPENIAKLFELDGFTTKGTNQESGTGLGLIICKEFIEKNNGTIGVSSKPNQGTTFVVTLPVKPNNDEAN